MVDFKDYFEINVDYDDEIICDLCHKRWDGRYFGALDGINHLKSEHGIVASYESKASEFTPLELYETIEPLWNNLSENDRKKIIINTTNGFVGQDNNIKSNWDQIDHMTQQRIADNWDNAFNMIDEDKKTIYGLESYASEDSLIKIEDNEDEDTKVTVLDEWKNETDPSVGGDVKGIDQDELGEFGDYEVKCDCDKDPDCETCGGKGTNTWTSTVGGDESLKADWDESNYEEKYAWLKDLGVEDGYKYANLTLYELPEQIWKLVNEDYVQGFKQLVAESYKPDQKDTVETAEEKIISRKLDNVPVGQIARELVLWDNMSEDEAEKMVSETEPSDNDMSAKSLFNKKYSELNENELEEMELYDV